MRKLVAALAVLAIAFLVAQPALADSPPLEAASSDASITTQATKWRTISTPEQLRHLTLKSEGFGPGYYRIANDFTLGDKNNTDDDVATCALLSVKFVIDFNGHTVQSACENLATFTVQGANVTFLDSKATSNKVSVNGLGAGCIELRKGSVAILNGNYACKKFSGAGGSAVHVGGGTCTIGGGAFSGTYCALYNAGGKLTVNGGKFYGGYPHALLVGGGTTKLAGGVFTGANNGYGHAFAIGALTLGKTFNANGLLAKGASWSQTPSVVYHSNTADWSYYPTYAVSYMTMPYPFGSIAQQSISVKGKVGAKKSAAVIAPSLKSIETGKRKATVTWEKISGATKYQVRYSTAKSMKGAKTANVAKSKTSCVLKKLASKKRCYAQVRAFRSIGGHSYYSTWSAKKSAVVK